MSYAIRYGPEKQDMNDGSKTNRKYLFALFVLGITIAGVSLWPDGAETLRLALCPWLDQGTVDAWNAMVEQVRDGTGVVPALTAFCQEVIRNALILV